MELIKLLDARENCCAMLSQTIFEFVRENGEDCTEYEINQFGLECENEEHVTKVWNFFDRGGCYFFEPDKLNEDGVYEMNEENYYDKLYAHTVHTAYQCLYICVDKDGNETLRYYRFVNGGITFDNDQAEPEHGNVFELGLIDLHYLISGIKFSLM